MRRPVGPTIVAVLALAQAAFGVLRTLGWFRIGSDLMGQGLLILPIIGMVAYARGALVAAIGLLYVAFALGIFTRRSWARPVGFTAAAVNLLLALSVLIQGEFVTRELLWLIVPVIIVWYLLSPGRELSERDRAIQRKSASSL